MTLDRALSPVTRRQARVAAALQAQTLVRARALWRLFDPEDWASVNPWAEAMLLLVTDQYARHAATARITFQQYRLEQLGQIYAGTLPRPELVSAAARTSLIVTGPVWYQRLVRNGRDPAQALTAARDQVAATAGRIGLQGDRQQILAATSADSRSQTWTRQIMSSNPCALCVDLSGFTWTTRASGRNRDPFFVTHVHCMCQAVPDFS